MPVHTRVWCSVVMIPLASLMCLMQTAFFAQNYTEDSPGYVFAIVCVLISLPAGFLLLARSEYPEPTFWIACIMVAVFPFDSMLVLMAMTALLARRSQRNISIRTVIAGTAITLWSQLRDATQPAKGSLWHLIFAKPYTGGDSGKPIVMLVEEPTIILTAIITALAASAIATLLGLHIRSRARLRTANALANAATSHAENLQTDLNNQQLADAIAAEAHDTLAHSLSLLALNASALKAEASKLGDSSEAQALADKAEDIRRQSAGALDEAHSIIDMLRNPQQAWEQLGPSDSTSLTRESLDALIADVRNSGTSLSTWIDIHQLSELDESMSKIAYRAVQEGLTNARRHAPGAPVSLEITVSEQSGVHIHISNPLTNDAPTSRTGAGLSGLVARVQSVGGQCRYGMDDRRLFHVDVLLPWRS
ncbi:sensor histidine kinase [Bifidobacterium felsineum]|uniref:histidine kinase n=2 Tax=Bifidobacterium felsineum TaxID=2045440 RepID=A0A2M9HL20_9BIFI|nr:sensor histidine kinase [Bifidobacterium felsineum]